MIGLQNTINEEISLLSKTGEDLLSGLKNNLDPVCFSSKYNQWYTQALPVIQNLLPDRLSEFERYYQLTTLSEKSNSIADFLLSSGDKKTIQYTKRMSAIGLLSIQIEIVKSTHSRLKSILPNIRNILQADLLDSELDKAEELLKNGYLRAAGILAGVVLESHLKLLCSKYGIYTSKGSSSLSNYCHELCNKKIFDDVKKKHLFYLCKIRNLCAHPKEREPTLNEILTIIKGASEFTKII